MSVVRYPNDALDCMHVLAQDGGGATGDRRSVWITDLSLATSYVVLVRPGHACSYHCSWMSNSCMSNKFRVRTCANEMKERET